MVFVQAFHFQIPHRLQSHSCGNGPFVRPTAWIWVVGSYPCCWKLTIGYISSAPKLIEKLEKHEQSRFTVETRSHLYHPGKSMNIPGLQHGHHDHGANAVHGHQRWRDGPGVAEAPETRGPARRAGFSGREYTLEKNLVWIKQRHKPPIWEWFQHVYTTYKNGDDWGMVYYCVTHIIWQLKDEATKSGWFLWVGHTIESMKNIRWNIPGAHPNLRQSTIALPEKPALWTGVINLRLRG